MLEITVAGVLAVLRAVGAAAEGIAFLCDIAMLWPDRKPSEDKREDRETER